MVGATGVVLLVLAVAVTVTSQRQFTGLRQILLY